MFNIFKTNSEKTNSEKNNNSANTHRDSVLQEAKNNAPAKEENKKVHGEDGVCCGGCGGQ